MAAIRCGFKRDSLSFAAGGIYTSCSLSTGNSGLPVHNLILAELSV